MSILPTGVELASSAIKQAIERRSPDYVIPALAAELVRISAQTAVPKDVFLEQMAMLYDLACPLASPGPRP